MDGLIFFGTPHFRAGLAQWALISAKKLGISCADRPRQQDWSELQEDLNLIAGMQARFYDLNPGPKLACYFSVLPTKKPELVSYMSRIFATMFSSVGFAHYLLR